MNGPFLWFQVQMNTHRKKVNRPRLGLLCWGFKGVQEEIRSEGASTLQIGSVAFPAGQYTSPQVHPCHRLFHRPYCPDLAPCDFCLFPKLRGCRYETIEEMFEAGRSSCFGNTFYAKLKQSNTATFYINIYYFGCSSYICILTTLLNSICGDQKITFCICIVHVSLQ